MQCKLNLVDWKIWPHVNKSGTAWFVLIKDEKMLKIDGCDFGDMLNTVVFINFCNICLDDRMTGTINENREKFFSHSSNFSLAYGQENCSEEIKG